MKKAIQTKGNHAVRAKALTIGEKVMYDMTSAYFSIELLDSFYNSFESINSIKIFCTLSVAGRIVRRMCKACII